MTLGLVARADQRGIGIMTAEFHKHMKPDKVLIIDHGQWPQNFEQYDCNWIATAPLDLKTLGLHETTCRMFLEGLDVVYCVETLYDWRFKQWAEDAGCRVVIHGMPELYSTRDHANGRPQPDQWLWPTYWLVDDGIIPRGAVLPVPFADRLLTVAKPDLRPLRVLHTAGVRAHEDRNGTLTFIEALKYVTEPVIATIITQDTGLPGSLPRYREHVDVNIVTGGLPDRWGMYVNQHVLVLPRKYGGLCLPAQEAMACGLAVTMPDCSPNTDWPIAAIPVSFMQQTLTPYGHVPSAVVTARSVARKIDQLAADRDYLADRMCAADTWANLNTWADWRPVYEEALA